MSSSEKPKRSSVIKTLGLKRTTGLKQFKNLMEKRRMIRNGELESDWKLVCSRDGFYQKVPDEVRAEFDGWVRNHPMTIYSPLPRDSVMVPDPENPKLKIRKNKLLLQCSIRELYRDLYDEKLGMGDSAIDSKGGN